MIILLKNIVMKYGNRTILDNVNLEIDKGEFLCVTGASGTGKSTLLHIIGLLLRPTSGHIDMFGIPNVISSSRSANHLLRDKIGFVFQNYGLIENESIDYNLDIIKKGDTNFTKKKQAILESLDIHVPSKTKAYKLSGGEQQRVALARLILKDPELILCDEPTGSLDIENAKKVMDILEYLNQKNKTIVIVSHDNSVMCRCRRVIDINNLSCR